MLLQGNKFRLFVCLFICLLVCSCKNEQKKLKEQRRLFYERSLEQVDSVNYYKIYNQAIDSIIIFNKNKLGVYEILNEDNWQLDSLLCFNKIKDKFISNIMIQGKDNETNNSLIYFYGVKIKDKWCFFLGPTVYLFSQYYGLPPDTGLSFEKMKQIATKQIYGGYLKKDKKTGKWIVNDNFFWDLTSVAWCSNCATQEDWDRRYLEIIQENWRQK